MISTKEGIESPAHSYDIVSLFIERCFLYQIVVGRYNLALVGDLERGSHVMVAYERNCKNSSKKHTDRTQSWASPCFVSGSIYIIVACNPSHCNHKGKKTKE